MLTYVNQDAKKNQVYYVAMVRNVNHIPSRNYLWLALAFMLLIFVMAIIPLFTIEEQKNLLIEDGLFESLTVYLYIFCLFLIYARWSLQKIISKWYFTALIVLFTLRELDYDKAHFTHGVLKSKQYFSNLVGVSELIVSIIILIFILLVLGFILIKEKDCFIDGIKTRKQSQLAILTSIILIIITKSVDGLRRKLDSFGIDLSQSGEQLALIVEEVGEMGIPIMFVIAIISFQKK